MIRLQTYAAFSLLPTMSAVYYAFRSREQFYPAMVYLSNSKICFVLLLNTGLVAMCAAWQLVKRIFLGTLQEAEVERPNEQSWHRMDMALARNRQQLLPPAAEQQQLPLPVGEQQQLPPPPTKQQWLPAHATSSGCSLLLCLQRWIYVSLRQQTR
jgi:hypothetical protein